MFLPAFSELLSISGFIHRDDIVPWYLAVLLDDFLECKDIRRMQLSVYSPVLNPLEHVWICLGDNLQLFRTHTNSNPELKRVLPNS